MARLDAIRQMYTARERRVRNVITGTTERPRLMLHVSNRGFEAQIIDDSQEKTLIGMRTTEGSNVDQAEKFGKTVAEAAKKAKISKVVFDRGGKRYHGRIQAFADAARKAGLEF